MSLEELIIGHAIDPDFRPPQHDLNPAGVMMIPIPCAGRLLEVLGLKDAEDVAGIESISITAHPGQELLPLPDGSQYLGFLFARGIFAGCCRSFTQRSAFPSEIPRRTR